MHKSIAVQKVTNVGRAEKENNVICEKKSGIASKNFCYCVFFSPLLTQKLKISFKGLRGILRLLYDINYRQWILFR